MEDYIVFTVSQNYYALSVASIQRIIQVPWITPIPNAHRMIDGMISYENRVIKVVDFCAMMGVETYEEKSGKKSQKLLIYQTDKHFFAIRVDQIEEIVNLECSSLKHVERLETSEGFVELDGVIELNEKLVNIIKSVTLPIKEKA